MTDLEDNYDNLEDISTYLKDSLTLMVENRPEDAIEFLSNYFNNVVSGTSSLVRAKRYICLSSRNNRKSFNENVVSAFSVLKRTPKDEFVPVREVKKLVDLILKDFQKELSEIAINNIIGEAPSQVSFQQFICIMDSTLLFEELYKKLNFWWKKVDENNVGQINFLQFEADFIELLETPEIKKIGKTHLLEKLKKLKKTTKSNFLSKNSFFKIMFEMTNVLE